MATFTETTVQVVIKIRDEGVPRMIVSATSYDEDGNAVRQVGGWDVTDSLTAGQKTTIGNMLTIATERAKARLNIA